MLLTGDIFVDTLVTLSLAQDVSDAVRSAKMGLLILP